MLDELYSMLECSFIDRDRERCVPIIHRIVELAGVARQGGVLMLETEMEHESSLFLQTGLSLIIDGRNPDTVRRILKNLILAGRYTGSELLSRLIMAEGVLAIQQSENPRVIGTLLFSMLGEKYLSAADEAFLIIRKRTSRLNQFIASQRSKRPMLESMLFEETLISLDDRAIQAVVYEFDEITIFKALYGCGHTLLSRVMTNLSVNVAMGVIDEWEKLEHVHNTTIIACQDEILKRLNDMEAAGEIIIARRAIQNN